VREWEGLHIRVAGFMGRTGKPWYLSTTLNPHIWPREDSSSPEVTMGMARLLQLLSV
jgi:hypothetical protein